MEAQGDLGVKFFLTNIRYGWMFTASFGSDAEDDGGAPGELRHYHPGARARLGAGDPEPVPRRHGARREEYLWKAITGDADTGDDWDTYVAQWMRAGGEAVLAEARAQHAEM